MHTPHIVHFSGHGSPTGEIILTDSTGESKPVSTNAIKALFTTLKDNIHLVVLNACYSRLQAEAIKDTIDCVIGMSTAIGDRAAITFAASFYRAVGFGRSIQQAFDQGRTALLLEGIAEDSTPELLVRAAVDPSRLFLISRRNAKPQNSIDRISINAESPNISTLPFVDCVACLRLISGNNLEKVFPLERLRMTVGRSSVADIQLPYESRTLVSRTHFVIIYDPDNRFHIVQDLGALNRITINGRIVPSHSQVELKAGDKIKVGNTVLRYERAESDNWDEIYA